MDLLAMVRRGCSIVGDRANLGEASAQIASPREPALPDEIDRRLGSLPLAIIGYARKVYQVLLIPRPAPGIARDQLHRDQMADLRDLRDQTRRDLDRLGSLSDLRLDAAGGEEQIHDRTTPVDI